MILVQELISWVYRLIKFGLVNFGINDEVEFVSLYVVCLYVILLGCVVVYVVGMICLLL